MSRPPISAGSGNLPGHCDSSLITRRCPLIDDLSAGLGAEGRPTCGVNLRTPQPCGMHCLAGLPTRGGELVDGELLWHEHLLGERDDVAVVGEEQNLARLSECGKAAESSSSAVVVEVD